MKKRKLLKLLVFNVGSLLGAFPKGSTEQQAQLVCLSPIILVSKKANPIYSGKMISPETTKEFQEALREEYGKDVSFDDAATILRDVTGYFDSLSKIYHRMQTEKYNDILGQ